MDKRIIAPHPDICGPTPTEDEMADMLATTLPQLSLIKALIRTGITPKMYELEYLRLADEVLKEQIEEAKYKA